MYVTTTTAPALASRQRMNPRKSRSGPELCSSQTNDRPNENCGRPTRLSEPEYPLNLPEPEQLEVPLNLPEPEEREF